MIEIRCFGRLLRTSGVIDPVKQLIGPDLRLHGSKLNMKSAGYGAPVEWHQDWAFYPHTNEDVLAIGIMLDDVDGLKTARSRSFPVAIAVPIWESHSQNGR